MGDLTARFETLVTRAQLFIGGLQRELDRPVAEESAFLALKEELLAYLERFVRELVAATYRISNSLRALEVKGVEPLLHASATAELAKCYRPQRLCARARAKVGGTLAGLRGWFIGGANHPAQAESLRSRAWPRSGTAGARAAYARPAGDRAIARPTFSRWPLVCRGAE